MDDKDTHEYKYILQNQVSQLRHYISKKIYLLLLKKIQLGSETSREIFTGLLQSLHSLSVSHRIKIRIRLFVHKSLNALALRSPDPVQTSHTSQVSCFWITGCSQTLIMVKLPLAPMLLRSGTNCQKSWDLRQCWLTFTNKQNNLPV